MNHYAPLFGFALLCALMVGCASATPVEDAPLAADDQAQLECLVVGTWYHQSSDGTPIFEEAQNRYHIEADGTGHIEPNQGSQDMGMMGSSITDFEWWLEGRNLHMDRADGQEDIYRIDDWSPDAMTWFFYANSTDYGVGRHDDAELPEC